MHLFSSYASSASADASNSSVINSDYGCGSGGQNDTSTNSTSSTTFLQLSQDHLVSHSLGFKSLRRQ